MTDTYAPTSHPERVAHRKEFLMCAPLHYDVVYSINPWMHPTRSTDPGLALAQWSKLKQTYEELGHTVHAITDREGLPDMVFAANGGLTFNGSAYGAKFHHAERQPEGPAYLTWLSEWSSSFGATAHPATEENEGEGDFLIVGQTILAGHGFRTALSAHSELHRLSGLEVLSLQLTDPRFYHLDTALTVLDAETIAYYPAAFDLASQRELSRRFPDAIVASEFDAVHLGLNAVSDGKHVVMNLEATRLADQLTQWGYTPVTVDTSELRKAGGGPKCCTLELRGPHD